MKNLMEVLTIDSFVEDPQNYSDLNDFWKHTFTELTGLPAVSYVHNQYANGKEILDGNPIFSSRLDTNTGLRIIQAEPDEEKPGLAAWFNETTVNEKVIIELVIALQLNLDTYTEALHLMNLYYNDALTPVILKGINEKYQG
jgi:hypothetical protein